MQRLLQPSLRPFHTPTASQGLQKAVVRALELRHADVLRHLGSNQQHAEFASVLAALPARKRADALSLLEPRQREVVLNQLPLHAQRQWQSLSAPSAKHPTKRRSWFRSLRRSLRQA